MADRPPLHDYSRSRAVLVGTWDYSFLEPIPAAENSLRRMEALLTGPLCGWPRERLLVVKNERDPSRLHDRLVTAFDGITGVALFYFVGHGQMGPDDQLCLGLELSRPEPNRRTATSLRFPDVRQALNDGGAATRIVILDCCFAGLATVGTQAGSAGDVLDHLMGTGAYTMAATSAYATAWYEHDPGVKKPQTYFTKYLVDLVEKGLPKQPSRLRLDVVYKQVHDNLALDERPVPRHRAVDDARDFAFAYNAAPPQTQSNPELELDEEPVHPDGRGRRMLFLIGAAAIVALAVSLVLWLIPGNGEASVPPTTELPAGGVVSSVAYSPNGEILAAGDTNGTVHEWQTGTDSPACSMTDPDSQGVNSVAFNGTSTLLAAADGNGHVYLWACGGSPANQLTDPTGSSVTSVAFSSDGGYLAVGDAHGGVYVWKPSNYTTPYSSMRDPQSDGVNSVAFNYTTAKIRADTLLVSGDGNGNIDLWIHQKVPVQLHDPSGGSIQSVAFTPDNRFLVAGDTKGNVYEWSYGSTGNSIQKGRIVAMLTDRHGTDIDSVAVNPNTGVIAAADTDGYIILGKASVTQVLIAPASHGLRSVAFSPFGGALAAGGTSGYVYLWDLSS